MEEPGFLPGMGQGYAAPDLPITIDANGRLVVLKYTPTGIDPEEADPTAPISILVPYQPPGQPLPPEEEIIYAPVIETVAPPTAMFDSVSSAGYSVQFINESLGDIEALVWDFGDGSSSTEFNPIHQYAVAGNFFVTLTVRNAGGEDTHIIQVVSIAPTPSAAFSFAIGGYTVYLTNLSNTSSWLWSFGDGHTSTDKDPKHVYTNPGTYTITLSTNSLTVTKTVVIDVEILLEWKDNSEGEEGFKIEHSLTGEEGSWEEIAVIENPDVESYGVTQAKNGVDSTQVNFFRVLAYSGAEDSDPSNESNVRCG